MNIQFEDNGKKGSFFIEEHGKRVASLTFTYAGETKFIIDHTEVDESQAGKGLGKLLVKAAVEFARSKHLKIMPLCPYARSVFDKTPEYSDVLF